MRRQSVILVIGICTAMLFAACATVSSSEKARRRAETATTIDSMIDARNFKINVSMMNALRGYTRPVTPEFYLRVSGDSLFSYLPYLGRAYSVPYGGGKGLNFDSTIDGFDVKRKKDGCTSIVLTTRNEEDSYKYRINIFDNGHVDISVIPQRRDQISFEGDVEM